jgi:hypothetical protein
MCNIFNYVSFEVPQALTVKNTVFWVAIHIVRREPDVSEEHIASIYNIGDTA